jgi:protein-S-isoprenylcysteine O-methyltransferase Ste14
VGVLATWPFGFWQAWLYFAVATVVGVAMSTYLLVADPKLVKRRLRGPNDESHISQKLLQVAAPAILLGTFLLCWLDHRFSWSHVPQWAVIGGDGLLVVSLLIVFLALRANTFAASNIVVEVGQYVIATGPYAIVRHPYYSGMLVSYVATPIALGSYWGLLVLAPVTLMLVSRIRFEERFLSEHLRGYAEYCRTVRYRLAPPIW